MAGVGKSGRDGMDADTGLNCAACEDAEEESDAKGGILLRCMRMGLRGICGRVVSAYPAGRRNVENCSAPVWCERRKND